MLDDLSRPDAYPRPRPARVTVETTHASWVFLAGNEVRKVKRPVNYGFLDYSDEEKRRRCCEEEVRLGRRLAPDVYNGVVPIYRGPGGHTFVGPGAIVDHAVAMRRLDDGDSALALLRARRLEPQHLRRLAQRLATFYATAPVPPDGHWAARFAATLQENHDQTLPWSGRFVSRKTVDDLHRWQAEEAGKHRQRLDARAAAQRIREGHGDLRLEHVYFPQPATQPPLVIDPIEFNDSFRNIDAALDVAFLAMELDASERPELAAGFLSDFAAAASDYELYPLLNLYLAYRAHVRAKVACFVAGDPNTPADKARRKADEATRLFALAAAYGQGRPGTTHVIAVGGLIATGKTTIARALGQALQLPVISSDETRKQLAGITSGDRGGPELYTEAVTQRTYQEMLRRAAPVLDSDRGVILDATFRDGPLRAQASELARAYRRPFLFVEVACDPATLRARLRARAAEPSVSDAREDLLPWMQTHYQPPTELPITETLTADGSADPATTLAAIQSRLQKS